MQATIGSAQLTRGRAQEAVDELVRTAGSSAEAVRERVIGVYEDRRPVTNEDLSEIRAELRKISRRLAAIEKRLSEDGDGGKGPRASGRASGGRAVDTKTASGGRAGSAKGAKSREGSSSGRAQGSRGSAASRGASSSRGSAGDAA
ncbi:MAG: hypothetical protein AVDCRST_MAG11-42 [uncultured Gemmatimonadaceae bacterium]|uniref:Uncharacterized protein n=1 Tax=uncultured Gemmatimonadaceae bacterium TaxID=246130 RepID=A0A6J4JXS0_9BACT|nr:MAG: hypothetical protein AVDCRST_MAG11-42 [uncultured Gemmatimonadaceae bacterium]